MPLFHPDNTVPLPALIKRFAWIYLPLMLVLGAVVVLSMQMEDQRILARIELRENNRIGMAKVMMTHGLGRVKSDLRILADLPVLRHYVDSGNALASDEAARVFRALSQYTQHYDQLRYLDAKGMERIRINFNDGQSVIVAPGALQDKSARYYFKEAIQLAPGEIYISPLDLNVEYERIERPYKPVIRFAMPVDDSAGHRQGLLVLNYLVRDELQHFRSIMGGNERTGMLLNSDGYWLSSPDAEDEWGFMLGKADKTFQQRYPQAWPIISAQEKGAMVTEQGLFVYDTAYPLAEPDYAMRVEQSAHAATRKTQYWKIVSFVPRTALASPAFYSQPVMQAGFVLVALLFALAAWMIALLTLTRQQARRKLAQSHARYDDLVSSIPIGVYLFRARTIEDMHFEYVSPVFCEILGLQAEAVLKNPGVAFAATHPDDLNSLVAANRHAVSNFLPLRWEGRFIVHGQTRWIRIASDPRLQPEGCQWSGIVNDISERKKLQQELEYQAHIDVLTGLNNRRHFLMLAEQQVARARRHHSPLSMMMLDIDYFKQVNDLHGHQVGDLALQELSRILVHILREFDIVGRIGGEEFAILLPETTHERAREVAERLRQAVADARVQLDDGTMLTFTVSIGVADMVDDAGIDTLMKRADDALYEAKNTGRNRVCMALEISRQG